MTAEEAAVSTAALALASALALAFATAIASGLCFGASFQVAAVHDVAGPFSSAATAGSSRRMGVS